MHLDIDHMKNIFCFILCTIIVVACCKDEDNNNETAEETTLNVKDYIVGEWVVDYAEDSPEG